MQHSLSKSEKLCSRTKIEQLFADGQSFARFPLRIVYRIHPTEATNEQPQFFISVPKRKFKRAVKRVWLRRRVREAYRLHKEILPTMPQHTIDMAFLYIASEQTNYAVIEKSMVEILQKLASNINKDIL